MKKHPQFLLLIVLFFGFQTLNAQQKLSSGDLEQVFSWMSGRFSSEKQAAADSAFFSISLKMRPIWQTKGTGKWLYVEQAMAGKKPYRQRVYQLEQLGDSVIRSTVYELPSPDRFVGGTEDPALLDGLTRDSLISRQGCAISLRKGPSGLFAGSTPGKQCLSSLRGARYATSRVEVRASGILSWDQGWNEKDEQVWGAVKGGYQFEKLGGW